MLLSDLEFGSLLVYSPRGTEPASQNSRTFSYALKEDRIVKGGVTASISIAQGLAAYLQRGDPPAMLELREILTDDVVLVPVPGSGKQDNERQSDQPLWPPQQLAKAMVDAGVGAAVRTYLYRKTAVPKSSRSDSSVRDPHLHYRTMAINNQDLLKLPPLEHGESAVLVDDVVTSGATLLGAASRLRAEFPSVRVSGFAAVRTMSGQEVERMLEPVVGKIRRYGQQCVREP